MRLLFLVGVLLVNIAALAADKTLVERTPDAIYPAGWWTRKMAIEQVVQGTARFSGKIIQQVARNQNNGRNLIVSPLGVALALALTSFGARGKTEIALHGSLGLDAALFRRKVGFQSLVNHLNSYTAVDLKFATGLFLGKDYQFNPDFAETAERAFCSTVEHVDFRSEATVDHINDWCKNKTDGRIESIVNRGDIDGNTLLVLVNALYFKGTWWKQFNKKDTAARTFFLSDGTTKQVPFMTAVNMARRGKYQPMKAEFIELPYVSQDNDHNVSMFIILPEDSKNLNIVEANLHKFSISDLLNTGKMEEVEILLPKFKIESKLDLVEPLKEMGMDILFDGDKSDYSGIIEESKSGDEDLWALDADHQPAANTDFALEKIIQKAFIEVNEEGSEAAAATEEIFSFRSLDDAKPTFNANRAFYAFLATTDSKPIILFAARFTGVE